MKIAKSLILEACMQKQNELISSFREKLEGMESDAFKHNDSPSQSEDRSVAKLDLINAITKELDFALRELEFLKTLSVEKECTVVEPGAVVVTDKMTLYICVSIESFKVDNHSLFGISTKAPIYAGMRGLEKGKTFQFNETVYNIKDIY